MQGMCVGGKNRSAHLLLLKVLGERRRQEIAELRARVWRDGLCDDGGWQRDGGDAGEVAKSNGAAHAIRSRPTEAGCVPRNYRKYQDSASKRFNTTSVVYKCRPLRQRCSSSKFIVLIHLAIHQRRPLRPLLLLGLHLLGRWRPSELVLELIRGQHHGLAPCTALRNAVANGNTNKEGQRHEQLDGVERESDALLVELGKQSACTY